MRGEIFMQGEMKARRLGSMREVAAVLGISERTGWRLDIEGKLPEGIRLNRCRRWDLMELDRYIDAGCPPRRQWETMKNGGK
jgi:predicted DNA-binding transcriptional regulator AlpA